MKKLLTLFLVLALVLTLGMSLAQAEGESPTFTYSVELLKDGSPLQNVTITPETTDIEAIADPTTINAGDVITVTVTMTRTDITEDTYQAHGLEMDIDNMLAGSSYVEGSGTYTGITGTSLTVANTHYASDDLLRFFKMGQVSQTFTLNKTVTVSANYTVVDPSKFTVYALQPIVKINDQTYNPTPDTTPKTFTVTWNSQDGETELEKD